ncbi:MAG: hypothetical protein WD696_10760 [Bryobacteraceae bacterium]
MNRLPLLAWCFLPVALAAGDSPSNWTEGVKVSAIAPEAQHHSIHSYFNTSPESPDGRWILLYASTTLDGHNGEVRIRERATGQERVLARNVTTEDAHRAACQQWISGGRRVVFHDLRGGRWVIVSVDVATAKERVLTSGRMLSWGQPGGDIVPIYGPHWAPGENRDLELLNVETGAIRKVLTADAVRAKYAEPIQQRFGDRPISIFFPILSPNGKRVIFKLATPAGGDFRSKSASDREMLIGYDLEDSRFLFCRAKWGHPAWHPNSKTLINVPNVLIDSDTGAERAIAGLPKFPGSHPCISPDGRLFATDTQLEPFGGKKGEWGVVVGDLDGKEYRILHRFGNAHGAASWRVSHPHPSFSADSRRVYFNVSAGQWTELHVAAAAAQKPAASTSRLAKL